MQPPRVVSAISRNASRPGGFVIDNPEGVRRRIFTLPRLAGLENMELDINKVLAAKGPNVPLQSEDIVFVPASKGKMAGRAWGQLDPIDDHEFGHLPLLAAGGK